MTEKDKLFLKKFCFGFTCLIVFGLQVFCLIDFWSVYHTKPLLLFDLLVTLIVIPWLWLWLIWLEEVKQFLKPPEKLIHTIKKWCANPWFWIVYMLLTFLWLVISFVWVYVTKQKEFLDVLVVLVSPFGYAAAFWAVLDDIIHDDSYISHRITK